MPLCLDTPFDRRPDTGQDQAAARPSPKLWRRIAADLCYLTLKAGGFTVATFLMTLGLPLFFFLLLAGWNMDLLFVQLDNLASRYGEADSARQFAFAHQLEIGFVALAGVIALARLPRFVREAARALAPQERL